MKVGDKEKFKKVLVWRVISTLFGWVISYAYLDNVTKSLELSVVIGVIMTVVHYVFEKWWEK
jgi:uncharacterized membrane protein